MFKNWSIGTLLAIGFLFGLRSRLFRIRDDRRFSLLLNTGDHTSESLCEVDKTYSLIGSNSLSCII